MNVLHMIHFLCAHEESYVLAIYLLFVISLLTIVFQAEYIHTYIYILHTHTHTHTHSAYFLKEEDFICGAQWRDLGSTSPSWVQAILLPQPLKWLGLQACATMPGLLFLF